MEQNHNPEALMNIKELLSSFSDLRIHRFFSTDKKHFGDDTKIVIVDDNGTHFDFFTEYNPELDVFVFRIPSEDTSK